LYLTLPICAGIECQDIKKERKTKNLCKGQLATMSERRVHGEILPRRGATENQGLGKSDFAMASKSCRGELKRPNPLKADVAEIHWGSNVNSPW